MITQNWVSQKNSQFVLFDTVPSQVTEKKQNKAPSAPGGRGQLRLFAIGLIVRLMQAIVTSLPVKPGKFE